MQFGVAEFPLHEAVLKRSLTEMKALLDQGSTVVTKNSKAETPLIVAVRSQFVDGVKLLLRRGAGVIVDVVYRPVYEAAKTQNIEIFKILLEHRGDFETPDYHGQTPLFASVINKFQAGFKYLLDKGVNVNARDNLGNTPLHYAADKNCKEFINLLLDKGANIESRNTAGETPVYFASEIASTRACKALIERGAYINIHKYDGLTPLHESVIRGLHPNIRLLLNSGAAVNEIDFGGCTPLHYASRNADVDSFRMLLEKGASLNIVDHYGETPVESNPNSAHWLEELQRMKTVRIGRWTLYDIFQSSTQRDPIIAVCSEMVGSIKSSQLETDFPHYGPVCKEYFYSAKRRYDLLTFAQKHLTPLPEEIGRLILSYLGKIDLKNFIKAFKTKKSGHYF